VTQPTRPRIIVNDVNLFLGYLTTFFLFQLRRLHNVGRLSELSDELERMWKEAAAAYFKIISLKKTKNPGHD
jgi:hypothetical protein